MTKEIESVDADCVIYYKDGTYELCQYCPVLTFGECGPGYGPNRDCAKWNYYHRATNQGEVRQ